MALWPSKNTEYALSFMQTNDVVEWPRPGPVQQGLIAMLDGKRYRWGIAFLTNRHVFTSVAQAVKYQRETHAGMGIADVFNDPRTEFDLEQLTGNGWTLVDSTLPKG